MCHAHTMHSFWMSVCTGPAFCPVSHSSAYFCILLVHRWSDDSECLGVI